MASNDMELIMYKILRYLYDCLKEGRAIREEEFCCVSRLIGDIPQEYWALTIRELARIGAVDGVLIRDKKDGVAIDASGIRITFEGVRFLKENSRMQEAKRFAGRAFEIVLESVIASI